MKITIWVYRDTLEALYKFLANGTEGEIKWTVTLTRSNLWVQVQIDYNDFVLLDDLNTEV